MRAQGGRQSGGMKLVRVEWAAGAGRAGGQGAASSTLTAPRAVRGWRAVVCFEAGRGIGAWRPGNVTWGIGSYPGQGAAPEPAWAEWAWRTRNL